MSGQTSAPSYRPATAGLYQALATTLVLWLAGCGAENRTQPSVQFFAPDAYPQKLSDWGVIRSSAERLELVDGMEPYDLNTPLFTDYAQKLRAIYLPPGTAAGYQPEDPFDFPVGTIISKTFFYPKADEPGLLKASYQWTDDPSSLNRNEVELLETRLLVRQADGWDALPYVWQGNDAELKLAGSLIPVKLRLDSGERTDLPYIVPTRNECAACHATDHSNGELQPIGPKARHLNRGYQGTGVNQLTAMAASGRLTGLPEMASVPLSARMGGHGAVSEQARAYLDINCGHCHNPDGAADTSGLHLDAATMDSRELGICKPPIAAGQGTGGRAYSIVPGDPDDSIIVFRMETSDPGARMPELGRSLQHTEGIALVRQWIAGLGGQCIEHPGAGLTDAAGG